MARSFLLEKLKLDDGNGQRLVTAPHFVSTVRGDAFKRLAGRVSETDELRRLATVGQPVRLPTVPRVALGVSGRLNVEPEP